ncbi:hypothetical protein [Nitrospira japonica]|nr:hypothetical protein [Nitrospira japonica]
MIRRSFHLVNSLLSLSVDIIGVSLRRLIQHGASCLVPSAA